MSNIDHSPSATLTGTRQTMASWARVIESYAAIPQAYQPTCAALFGTSAHFSSLILTPSSREMSRKISEKLLCTANNILTVLERDSNQINVLQFDLTDLRDIELGTILLYSWITVSGMTKDAGFASSTFAFNTATLRHFTPLVQQARHISSHSTLSSDTSEQSKLDYLSAHDFKFMNFAKTSLHPEAKVLASLWQPEIRTKTLGLLGWALYRTITTAHLLIVTDKELILIRDDIRVRSVRGLRHGGVWRYIPRRNLVSADVTESTGDLLTLSLFLTHNGRLDMLFSPDQRSALAEIQKSLS